MTSADNIARDFVIERVFAPPRSRVWRAWSEADELQAWWGPKGFSARVQKLDFRPGGLFHYCLVSPDGQEVWGRFDYLDISPPERISAIVAFSNPEGGVTRHPWNPDWPLKTLSTVMFSDADGGTRIAVRWSPHEASAAEEKAFDAGHGDMRAGWTGTFDQLEAHLAKG